MLCHKTECEQHAYTVDDSLIYTDAFYFLQMIHYYKKKYLNMREIIVVGKHCFLMRRPVLSFRAIWLFIMCGLKRNPLKWTFICLLRYLRQNIWIKILIF